MHENIFDEALEDISIERGAQWNDDSKIRLFARFMVEQGVSYEAWEKFLTTQADEEALGDSEDDQEEDEDDQEEDEYD